MYCKNCGAKISDNARFCPKCGTELKKINAGNASDKKVDDDNSAAENRTIPVKYLIAGAVFVLAIICIVVVIAVKHNGNDAEKNVESIAEISADNYEYTEIEANADNSNPAESVQMVAEESQSEDNVVTDKEDTNVDFEKCNNLKDLMQQAAVFTCNYDDKHDLTIDDLKTMMAFSANPYDETVMNQLTTTVDSATEQRFLNSLNEDEADWYGIGTHVWMSKEGFKRYIYSATADTNLTSDDNFEKFALKNGEYTSYLFEDYCVYIYGEAGNMGPYLGDMLSAQEKDGGEWELEFEMYTNEDGAFESPEYEKNAEGIPVIGKAFFEVKENEESVFDGYSITYMRYEFSDAYLMNSTPVIETEDESIHRYEIIVGDVTWTYAYLDCITKGGYLAHINSQEEFEAICDQIRRENHVEKAYYIGGKRDPDANDYDKYYWIKKDGTFWDESVNDNAKYDAMWFQGEPGFGSDDQIEVYLEMFYRKSEDRFYLNDIPEDITAIYPGSIGYICEYDE